MFFSSSVFDWIREPRSRVVSGKHIFFILQNTNMFNFYEDLAIN